MKISLYHTILPAIALSLLAWSVTGCAKNQGTAAGEIPLTDTIEGVSLPSRLENFNPDTDVNYQILKPYTVYFGFDSTIIKADQRGKLMKVQEYVKQHPGTMLFLAGHTDTRGTLEYNRGLGERRAQAVRNYLIGLGLNPKTLHTISYGEERPASKGTSKAAYAKNRRVQIGVIER